MNSLKKARRRLLFVGVFFFSAFSITGYLPLLAAEDGTVNVSVQVVELRSTDTINDFDFQNINSSFSNINLKDQATESGTVKGATDDRRSSFLAKIINFFCRLGDRLF